MCISIIFTKRELGHGCLELFTLENFTSMKAIKVHLSDCTKFRKGHRVVLHFRNRKGGKYRGAFLLAENDDLASKHELAHGVKRKRSD